MMKDNTGTADYTYEQAAKYCHDNLRDRAVPTAENEDTMRRIRDVAKQYAIAGTPQTAPPPHLAGHPKPIFTEISYQSGVEGSRYLVSVNEHNTMVAYDVKDYDPRNTVKTPQE